MWIKFIVIALLLFIVFNLGLGLFHMLKGQGRDNSDKTVKALTWRIGLSVAAFILLLVAHANGLIQPHGVLPPTP